MNSEQKNEYKRAIEWLVSFGITQNEAVLFIQQTTAMLKDVKNFEEVQ